MFGVWCLKLVERVCSIDVMFLFFVIFYVFGIWEVFNKYLLKELVNEWVIVFGILELEGIFKREFLVFRV